MHKMKKLALLLLALAMVLSLAACGGEDANTTPAPTATENVAETPAASDGAVQEEASVWDSAQYTEDTELGEGANTITFECTAEDRTVTFTIHTDAEYLRAALEDSGLIAGDESEFGMYVKTVNGMSADYEADGYYWSLYVDGEYATTGVDTTPVADGGSYAFVREAA